MINPSHPNLTIPHNTIHTCILIGVRCHFANITLKMIRAGTNCYTMAFCQYGGHEDALISVRDVDGAMIEKFTQIVKDVLKSGEVEPWGLTTSGKAELEEIAAGKAERAKLTKENVNLFMGDLEQGLDENSE